MNSVNRPVFRRVSPVARGGTSASAAMKSRFRRNGRYVMVTAHRGQWGPLPENSLASLRAATRWDVVEADVRLDRSGTPYLMHDRNLLRMTGQPIDASQLTREGRKNLRLRTGGGGTRAELTNETVPTLDEAFAALDRTGAVLDLDVKEPDHVEAVAHAVSALGCQDLAMLKMRVGSVADIAALVDLERRHDIMVIAKIELRSKSDLALVVALREADVAFVEVDFADVNLLSSATAFASDLIRFGTHTLDAHHSCGLSDSLALKDPRAVWGRLMAAGIRSITTDRPKSLARFLATQ